MERLAAQRLPMRLLTGDINEMRSRTGIERTVVDVLRKLGLLPPSPGGSRRPSLRLASHDEGDGPRR